MKPIISLFCPHSLNSGDTINVMLLCLCRASVGYPIKFTLSYGHKEFIDGLPDEF